MASPWLLPGLAALVTVCWLSWTANRLDRLHHRVDVARGTLAAQLLRRSGAALELAASESLDPPSRLVLLDAAHHARTADSSGFEAAESRLSLALRTVLGDPREVDRLRADALAGPLVHELAQRCTKVELARRFLNDVVASARALRSRAPVRWLRLAGHAPEPRTVDLDDAAPGALVG